MSDEQEDPLVTEAKDAIYRCIVAGKMDKWLADHIEALIDVKIAIAIEMMADRTVERQAEMEAFWDRVNRPRPE
jgi:hypothetical protein